MVFYYLIGNLSGPETVYLELNNIFGLRTKGIFKIHFEVYLKYTFEVYFLKIYIFQREEGRVKER